MYDFLNALEDRMSHANSAVALAAIKAFLHLTMEMTATHQQVAWRSGRVELGTRKGDRCCVEGPTATMSWTPPLSCNAFVRFWRGCASPSRR